MTAAKIMNTLAIIIRELAGLQYSPILIGPHVDVTIDTQPGSVDDWKEAHHAISLHVCVIKRTVSKRM